MSYVFLIMVLTSQSMNMQIEPMENMAQCQGGHKCTSHCRQGTLLERDISAYQQHQVR